MHVLPALHKAHTLPSPRHEPGTWNPCSLNRRRQSDRREQEGSLRAASPGIASRCHQTGFASFPKNCPRRRGGSSQLIHLQTVLSSALVAPCGHLVKLRSVAESEALYKIHIPYQLRPTSKTDPRSTLHHTYLRLDPESLGRDLSLQPAL